MHNLIHHVELLSEYQTLIDTSPCVVKFTAVWCNPCKRISPTYSKLAESYGESINFLEVDIDIADEISNVEDIKSIPLFLFYSGGKKLNLHVLGCNEDSLVETVELFVNSIPKSSEIPEETPEIPNVSEEIPNVPAEIPDVPEETPEIPEEILDTTKTEDVVSDDTIKKAI